MSQDSYFIGKKDGSPGIGVSLSNKAEVYQEAAAFCDKKSLEVFTLRETVTPAAPGRLGSTGTKGVRSCLLPAHALC